jgi:hypothetical protein
MIDCQHWQNSIVRYANLLLDENKIRRAWLQEDRSETSVTDFYELYEQIFDDLDSDSMIHNNEVNLWLRPFLKEFLDALKKTNATIEDQPRLLNSNIVE